MSGVVIPLWEGRPPHALGDKAEDNPFLTVFPAAPEVATGAAMLIFPGGSYSFLSPKSGEQYAQWLAQAGICGIVVHFRLGSNGYRYPALLADARRALVLIRTQAESLNVDPERIGVIGTSAGGHLAALLLTGGDRCPPDNARTAAAKPTLGVLCYPVISLCDPLAHSETRRNFLGDEWDNEELQRGFSANLLASDDVPDVFIWHTNTDDEVSADNSRLFAEALRGHGVPYELHLYGAGPHALGLARAEGLHWADDCIRWLRMHGF
jgi:acetyl esterase/lipase